MWPEPEVAQREPEVENGYFQYKVTIWDEVDDKESVHCGLAYADTYTAAVRKIEDYFGNTIINLQVYGLESDPVFDITDSTNCPPDMHELFVVTYKENDNDF